MAVRLDKMGCLHEVDGECNEDLMVRDQLLDSVPDFCPKNLRLSSSSSTTKRDTFSLGCWVEGASENFQEDLTAVLWRIESQLRKYGFDWVDVLYIHLYISDMKCFTLANEVYVRFITEKQCVLGVPSRSTIELPLKQVGYGHAFVEVLVANDQCKRVLHVQSISCWAPSCIGPYSQATFHKEVLYMAGQLGLDPPTMTLCSGGLTAELVQTLENCEAVANSFNTSMASSPILIVIYCSSSLQTHERDEIQQQMSCFFRQKVSNLQNIGRLWASDPIFLYVLVPDLPKGALVELKPILHIPEDGEESHEVSMLSQACNRVPPYSWGIEFSKRHGSCCQKYISCGKICAMLVFITNDMVVDICSKTVQNTDSFLYNNCSSDHMKAIMKFCIYLLDETLKENNFSWEDLKNLRFYFTTEFSATADVLSLAVSDVLGDFSEATRSICMVEQIFNLIPVLGSGRSASMDALVTCELFASKI